MQRRGDKWFYVIILLILSLAFVSYNFHSPTGFLTKRENAKALEPQLTIQQESQWLDSNRQNAQLREPYSQEMDGAQDISILTFEFERNGEIIRGPKDITRMEGFLPPQTGRWRFVMIAETNEDVYAGYTIDQDFILSDTVASDGSFSGEMIKRVGGEFAIVVSTNVLQQSTSVKFTIMKNDGELIEKIIQLPQAMMGPKIPTPKFTCNAIINNGNPNDKLDLVFVGDDYDKQGEFIFDAKNQTDFLLTYEPFTSQNTDLNFYFVTPSLINATHGCFNPPSNITATTILTAASVCPYDKIIVLVKSFDFGGGYAVIPTWSCNKMPVGYPFLQTTVLHELGHLFWLADQSYAQGQPPGVPDIFPNCEYVSTCPLTSNLGSACRPGCRGGYQFREGDTVMGGATNYSINHTTYGVIGEEVVKAGVDYFTQNLMDVTVFYTNGYLGWVYDGINVGMFKTLFGAVSAFNHIIVTPPILNATGFDVVKGSADGLHISFYDAKTGSLYYTNSSFEMETIEQGNGNPKNGWETSIAMSNDLPAIAYSNGSNVLYTWYDGSMWNRENLAKIKAQWIDLDFDNNGIPFIAFGDGQTLYLASMVSPSNWLIQPMGFGGYYAKLKIDNQNKVHIAYVDKTFKLQYLVLDGTTQSNFTIELMGLSYHVSLTLDQQGNPYVSYLLYTPSYPQNLYELKYAYSNGFEWTIKTIERNTDWPDGASFSYNDINIDDHGNILMAYPINEGVNWMNIVYYDITHQYKRIIDYFPISSYINQPLNEVKVVI